MNVALFEFRCRKYLITHKKGLAEKLQQSHYSIRRSNKPYQPAISPPTVLRPEPVFFNTKFQPFFTIIGSYFIGGCLRVAIGLP
jgi:hypothetical protein